MMAPFLLARSGEDIVVLESTRISCAIFGASGIFKGCGSVAAEGVVCINVRTFWGCLNPKVFAHLFCSLLNGLPKLLRNHAPFGDINT